MEGIQGLEKLVRGQVSWQRLSHVTPRSPKRTEEGVSPKPLVSSSVERSEDSIAPTFAALQPLEFRACSAQHRESSSAPRAVPGRESPCCMLHMWNNMG